MTADGLASKRKYAILFAFIAAAILTPPDVISQILLALPMWLLYEIGLHSSKYFKIRKLSNNDEEVYNDIANKK